MRQLILFILIPFIYVKNIKAQAGNLDSSFGSNGIVKTIFRNSATSFNSIAVQKDGKIVAAGSVIVKGTYDFAVARYNSDGTLDNTFSSDGETPTDFGGHDFAQSVSIQEDGKIVVIGNNTVDFALARYNIDGTLDTTFSSDGKLTTDFKYDFNVNWMDDNATSLAIQPDNKLIVAGTSQSCNDVVCFNYLTLARYNTDGTLDSTFSEDGKQTGGFAAVDASSTSSVVIQSDGKVVVAGNAFVRFNPNGTLDTIFRNENQYSATSIAIQTDGKIVVARGNTLFRYNNNGSNDNTFSVQTNAFNNLYINSVALQIDGKIVVAGYSKEGEGEQTDFVLARFNINGSLDSSFGKEGKKVTKVTGSDAISHIIISGNKLFAVGNGKVNSASIGITASYLLSSEKENTLPTISLTLPSNNATYLAPAAHIKLSAVASDAGGTINKVEFYNGSTLLHTETVGPYGFVWRNVPLGNYTLTAKAYDNSDNVTTSAVVHISVVPNKPPTVSIIAPLNNEHYASPAYIHLEAAASDPGGRITRVEFYNGTTLLRTEYKYPYTYVWKDVPAGTYTITAVATDNWGAHTTSAPIIVKVKPANPAIVSSKALVNNKNSLSTAESLMLYPNPVIQTLNIYTKGLQQNKPATISIISVSGTVWKTMQSKSLYQTVQLDVSSLVKGVYIMKLISGDKVLYKRFIK